MPNQPLIILYTIPEVFYRWNGIICKMEITDEMCNLYLGEWKKDYYDYQYRDNVLQREDKHWHYPKPSELERFEIALLIEKNHRDCGTQVSEYELTLLSENDERFFNYLNKSA